MLTYQLQDRVFHVTEGEATFPNRVQIEVRLAPAHVFGAADSPGRFMVKGREHGIEYNGNVGRLLIQPKPPLERLAVRIESPNTLVELDGNIVQYTRECTNLQELERSIDALLYLLPTLLSVAFPEPVFVESIHGKIGDAAFNYIHARGTADLIVIDENLLVKQFAECVERCKFVSTAVNRRLLAGLHYFSVASRLHAAGHSGWEFMAEFVLNCCKALDIMFGGSRDKIRDGLSQLGYSDAEIEGNFIPITILRNHFDVGHPRLAILRSEQLQTIYQYLACTESQFKELFGRILDRIANGSHVMNPPSDLSLDSGEQSELDHLVDTMSRSMQSAKSTKSSQPGQEQ